MIISIFLGSTSEGRLGLRVAKLIQNEVKKRGHEVNLIDPLEHEDLLIFKSPYKYNKNPSKNLQKVQRQIAQSNAYIAITPEYNHGYSGALKNAMDVFLDEYKEKTFGIVTYSTGGFGGIRAAEPLRLVCAELGANAIPLALAFSKAQDVINEKGELIDTNYQERIDKFLTQLEWYTQAMKNQKQKTPI